MSTLKVNTIQNTSAAHSSTPEEIAQGRAKVWVCFNGTTVTSSADMTGVRDSFNVSSVVDSGTGLYKINFSITFANTNFCVLGMSSDAQTQFGAYMVDLSSNSSHTRTTSSVSVFTSSSQALMDTTFNNVVVFGD
tara:strand:- start:7212 stop:7616 length:405 start_codon:yes stop_codon:yes gene_type:complete